MRLKGRRIPPKVPRRATDWASDVCGFTAPADLPEPVLPGACPAASYFRWYAAREMRKTAEVRMRRPEAMVWRDP